MQKNGMIQLLMGRFAEAMNNCDAAGLAACFVADGDFFDVEGKLSQGHDQIYQAHESLFAPQQLPSVPSFYNATFEIQNSSIRFIRVDVAAVDLTWQQTGITGPDGKPWPLRKGLFNGIAIEDDGEWLFVVSHNMVIG